MTSGGQHAHLNLPRVIFAVGLCEVRGVQLFPWEPARPETSNIRRNPVDTISRHARKSCLELQNTLLALY